MKTVYIQAVVGKANKKDLKQIKNFGKDLNFEYDEQYKTGWTVNIDSKENAELLAMRLKSVGRLKSAGLSMAYYMSIYEADGRTKICSIDLF